MHNIKSLAAEMSTARMLIIKQHVTNICWISYTKWSRKQVKHYQHLLRVPPPPPPPPVNLFQGWNEDIKPYGKDALFWQSFWLSAGRPLNTQLHRVMKRTGNVYYLHIRKNKRMLRKIKEKKLLEACLKNQNGIFTEIKAMRSNAPSFANTIDDNSENIPQYFANKYEKLYNSVNDEDDLRKIKKVIHQRIGYSDIMEVLKITPRIVKEASNKQF